MVFAYGSLLGFRIATNPLSALGAVGLMFVFGFAVGWIWVLLGLYVKSPQSLQGFGFIVMFPLAFGSNVFIQASTLPGWLQAWVGVNPRSRDQVARFFDGLDLLPPGLVHISQWGLSGQIDPATGGLVGYCAIARKP
jgi:hypothetical protein